MRRFDTLVVTPHILTEAWNETGIGSIGEIARTQIQQLAQQAIEVTDPAELISREPVFPWLGFADVALLLASTACSCPLITADGRLYREALARGIQAIDLKTEMIKAL